MEVLIFIIMIVGIVITAYSFVKIRKEEEQDQRMKNFDLEDRAESLNKTRDEAEDTIYELNLVSENILDEIELKYQELLFLYNLIDEKEKASHLINNIDIEVDNSTLDEKTKANVIIPTNPKYKEIFKLSNDGETIPSIARNLGIGQGEVKLILELGKER